MTTAISPLASMPTAVDAKPALDATDAVPLWRLFVVEWRKQLDTRAGRWLLVVIAVVTLATVLITVLTSPQVPAFGSLLVSSIVPLGLILPVIGILTATAERSQGTALVTYCLEPRRVRVGLAKLVAAITSGVAFYALATCFALAFHLSSVALTGGNPDLGLDPEIFGGALLVLVVGMAQGVAFGTLLRSTPVAIVSFYVVPVAFTMLGAVPGLAAVHPWIDITMASAPFLAGVMSADAWARLATAALLWVVAPLVAGLFWTVRSEIRTA